MGYKPVRDLVHARRVEGVEKPFFSKIGVLLKKTEDGVDKYAIVLNYLPANGDNFFYVLDKDEDKAPKKEEPKKKAAVKKAVVEDDDDCPF